MSKFLGRYWILILLFGACFFGWWALSLPTDDPWMRRLKEETYGKGKPGNHAPTSEFVRQHYSQSGGDIEPVFVSDGAGVSGYACQIQKSDSKYRLELLRWRSGSVPSETIIKSVTAQLLPPLPGRLGLSVNGTAITCDLFQLPIIGTIPRLTVTGTDPKPTVGSK